MTPDDQRFRARLWRWLRARIAGDEKRNRAEASTHLDGLVSTAYLLDAEEPIGWEELDGPKPMGSVVDHDSFGCCPRDERR
jgi:hypothetical protein